MGGVREQVGRVRSFSDVAVLLRERGRESAIESEGGKGGELDVRFSCQNGSALGGVCWAGLVLVLVFLFVFVDEGVVL